MAVIVFKSLSSSVLKTMYAWWLCFNFMLLSNSSSFILRQTLSPDPYKRCYNIYRAASKRKMGSVRPLDAAAGPMVWIDCEMTGLNPEKDKILEIAVLITNGDLEIMDEGVSYVIRTEKQYLDQMDAWCTKQHGRSGLTQSCLSSPLTRDQVAKAVLDYVKKWVPYARTAVLAGNSVHADRSFLVKEMPELVDWLHYRCVNLLSPLSWADIHRIVSSRIVDVSSIKELARRWYKHPSQQTPRLYESDHRALSDIRGSIKELRWYRQNLFVSPQPPPLSGF
ncbi:ribonuclease H-like domain-containing protein [Lentinula raphanica]|uniref:Ribonuclease H-like domain-containing protein n=1 Tax=Lentinula raphanica TaxID=153919 RepID=A0AA38P9M5_9AGAR|nr:ribonuclease H-like domain-containing protein [Lentinula raphanica]